MCNLDFKILRVSNRGKNCFEISPNKTYGVNIPPELKIPNKIIKCSVIQGSMSFETDATFESYCQIGVTCNLVQGFDTESDSSFKCKNHELLFDIDTSTHDRNGNNVTLVTFHPHLTSGAYEFLVGNIPEQIIFTSVATTGAGVLVPITNDNYISFILKFEYFDKK